MGKNLLTTSDEKMDYGLPAGIVLRNVFLDEVNKKTNQSVGP